ncbi:hypothetical protein TNIN_186761 [Trichonephila inaurata madagascariensis]|uniref:Uncharacterized protein n=1 Tax=Trichonephila inaurata madagascariensis TaxID=2747483 RepID=A0A8X6X915_9ARAC|nr:hypothetical protein TNIN_186761 [Trichonephila inaurata madagascariensis]
MFGRVFLKLLRKEVTKHIPFPKSDFDCIDAEIVLTTSMVELLCNHINENISSLFICFGCLEGYENQLDHECMTYSNEQRISEYGDLATLNMDRDKLVADFVNRNIQMKDIEFQSTPLQPYSIAKYAKRDSIEKITLFGIQKLTPIIMKLSRTANGEKNSSANTSSEVAPGPSTSTETTPSNHGRTISSISTAPSRKRTVPSTFRARNACLDTFEVYTSFPGTSTSKDLTVSLHSIKTEIF